MHSIDLEAQFGAHNYHPLPVVLTRGAGVLLWDEHGKSYLDFLSAYSAVNQGHCHPKILEALVSQAQTLTLTSRAFYNDQLGKCEQSLAQRFGYDKVLMMNTGVEAAESAIKLARKWAYEVKGIPDGQAQILMAQGNFWGRSLAAISASTDPESYGHFGPYVPGFPKIPYGDAQALKQALEDPMVAALMLEPIQGEAGVILPPPGYLAQAQAWCKEKNVLLILDEIQTGLGRTGAWLAAEHEGVRADVLVLGKALSGGFLPVSAVLCSNEVMDCLKPGQHGSTYGGNPLAARVAMRALQVLEEEGMILNAEQRGKELLEGLQALAQKFSLIKEVRGRGLLCAMELDQVEDSPLAWNLCLNLMDLGLLAKPTHGNKIRLAPPLCINARQIQEALDILEQGLARC